jgi:hypothetical protein
MYFCQNKGIIIVVDEEENNALIKSVGTEEGLENKQLSNPPKCKTLRHITLNYFKTAL